VPISLDEFHYKLGDEFYLWL